MLVGVEDIKDLLYVGAFMLFNIFFYVMVFYIFLGFKKGFFVYFLGSNLLG